MLAIIDPVEVWVPRYRPDEIEVWLVLPGMQWRNRLPRSYAERPEKGKENNAV